MASKNKPQVRFEKQEAVSNTNAAIMHLCDILENKSAAYNKMLSFITVREKGSLEQMWMEEVQELIRDILSRAGTYNQEETPNIFMLLYRQYMMGRGGSHIWFKKKKDDGNYELLFQFCFDSFY